jgi:hypothetical protein
MSQPKLLKKVVATLEAANTPYMLTGSYASSLQGEPRLTHDIDLVVAISSVGAQALIRAFPAPDYYLDEKSVNDAIASKGQFNLLDVTGGDKVDFWLLTDEPFDQSRFARRYVEEFEGQQLHVSRPEDTILMKLHWAQLSGGSEKQFGDARSVYELQSSSLDFDYIQWWAIALRITDLWERLRREAGLSGTQ